MSAAVHTYASAAINSNETLATDGACTIRTGTYPTKPAGSTVNSTSRSGPPNSGSGYSANVINSSHSWAATVSTRPSQNARLPNTTPHAMSTSALATIVTTTNGIVRQETWPDQAMNARPDIRSPKPEGCARMPS